MTEIPRMGYFRLRSYLSAIAIACILLFISSGAWALSSIQIEGGPSFFGVSSDASGTIAKTNSNSSEFFRISCETSLSNTNGFPLAIDPYFSVELDGGLQVMSLNTPSNTSGLNSRMSLVNGVFLFNLYIKRWVIGLGGGYDSIPLYYQSTSGSYFMGHSYYSSARLKLSKNLLTEDTRSLLLGAVLNIGGQGSGAGNDQDPNRSYGVDVRVTYINHHQLEYGLFGEYSIAKSMGPIFNQNSVEIRFGIEFKFSSK